MDNGCVIIYTIQFFLNQCYIEYCMRLEYGSNCRTEVEFFVEQQSSLPSIDSEVFEEWVHREAFEWLKDSLRHYSRGKSYYNWGSINALEDWEGGQWRVQWQAYSTS